MKKLVLTTFVLLLTSFSAVAADNDNKNSDLTNKSFELLVSKVDSIQLKGEVAPDDNLKADFKDLGDFLADQLFAVFSDDESEYEGPIENFKAECRPISNKHMASCELIIQYKIGEKAFQFDVELDKNNQPVSISDNSVYITRGD